MAGRSSGTRARGATTTAASPNCGPPASTRLGAEPGSEEVPHAAPAVERTTPPLPSLIHLAQSLTAGLLPVCLATILSPAPVRLAWIVGFCPPVETSGAAAPTDCTVPPALMICILVPS